MLTISRSYTSLNSSACVLAVAVMPAYFGIELDQVLDGDGAEDPALTSEPDAFFGFDGWLQSVGPTAILGDAALELIDQFDAAVLDDVIDIPAQQLFRVKSMIERCQERKVFGFVQIAAAQHGFDARHAVLGEVDVARVFVLAVVPAEDEAIAPTQPCGTANTSGDGGPAGDHQRDARFIDQDGIDLVDDDVLKWALDQVAGVVAEMIAQIIEADFVRGGVGDVGVRLAGVARCSCPAGPATTGRATVAIDAAHPFGVTAGQVVVDSQDVDAFATERSSGPRERRRRSVLPSPVCISAILPSCSASPACS